MISETVVGIVGGSFRVMNVSGSGNSAGRVLAGDGALDEVVLGLDAGTERFSVYVTVLSDGGGNTYTTWKKQTKSQQTVP